MDLFSDPGNVHDIGKFLLIHNRRMEKILQESQVPTIEDDELIPPDPASGIAQEEALASEMILEPSPTPIFEDILPSSPAMEPEQPTI